MYDNNKNLSLVVAFNYGTGSHHLFHLTRGTRKLVSKTGFLKINHVSFRPCVSARAVVSLRCFRGIISVSFAIQFKCNASYMEEMYSAVFLIVVLVSGWCGGGGAAGGWRQDVAWDDYFREYPLAIQYNPVREAKWVIDMVVLSRMGNAEGYAGPLVTRIDGAQYDESSNKLILTFLNPHSMDAGIALIGQCYLRTGDTWEEHPDIVLARVDEVVPRRMRARIGMTSKPDELAVSPSLAHHVCEIGLFETGRHKITYVVMLD